MKTAHRSSKSLALFSALLLFGVSAVACGDDDDSGAAGSANSAGTGGSGAVAGSGGSAGSGANNTGGSSGSSNGGSAGSGGSGGSTAGTAGVSGSSGSGGSGGSGGSSANTKSVSLKFAARINGEPFACGTTYDNVGSTSTSIVGLDFRFYVHDIELLKADGSSVPLTLEQDGLWQYQNVALLDFEDGTADCADGGNSGLNDQVIGTVPEGQYTGVRLKLGVPFELNHVDQATAPSPLSFTALWWNWQFGYKFTKIDAMPTAPGASAFFLHVGSTGCMGDPSTGETVSSCSNPNRAEFSFDAFDVDTQTLVVDYASIVANADVTQNMAGAPGCMSETEDPECVAIFPQLGLDIDTGVTDPMLDQTFLSVE